MDIEQAEELKAYLRSKGHIKMKEPIHSRVLAGGVSNRTVLVERASGQNWVMKQALAKLRVKVDWFSNPERIHREAEGMRYLFRFAPKGSITRLVFEDHEEHILAMEAVAEPHENWKVMLLRGELELDHVKQFAQLLATIARETFLANKTAQTGETGEIQAAFADRSYFETLRLEPYYLYTAQQVSAASPFLTQLVEDTRGRLLTLVHGDFSPKNVLVHRGKLILLDHEVIHFGDPAFDVGFAMTHFLSKAHHIPAKSDAFREAALTFWQRYASQVQELAFYAELEPYAIKHSLACLLARVRGRSPLEYLSNSEKLKQERIVLGLIQALPTSMEQMIASFVKGVQHVDH